MNELKFYFSYIFLLSIAMDSNKTSWIIVNDDDDDYHGCCKHTNISNSFIIFSIFFSSIVIEKTLSSSTSSSVGWLVGWLVLVVYHKISIYCQTTTIERGKWEFIVCKKKLLGKTNSILEKKEKIQEIQNHLHQFLFYKPPLCLFIYFINIKPFSLYSFTLVFLLL